MKRCARCGLTKPGSQFHKNRARADGLSGYCKVCQNEVNNANTARVRAEAIAVFGGPVCVRCTFDDPRTLVIDHIDGGGSAHRRQVVSSYRFYKAVIEHPERYQVLCHNCNWIKRFEEGECSSAEYVAKHRPPVPALAAPAKV